MKTFIVFGTIFLICTNILAQDSLLVYSAANRSIFRKLRNHNFSNDFVKENIKDFSYHPDSVLTKKSTLILYPHLKLNPKLDSSLSAEIRSLEYDLQISRRGKSRVVLVKLTKIRRKILHRQKINVHVSYDTLHSVIPIVYASFPFALDKDKAVTKWFGAYKNDGLRTTEVKPQTDSKDFVIHDMVRAQRQPMYLGIAPNFKYFNQPEPPLQANEGGNGYLMEGNFSMPFTIMQGRNDQAIFWRTASATIDPEFTWRITNDKTSAPLLPLNTKMGISLQRASILGDYQFADSESNNMIFKKDKKFRILNYGIQGMHYSNGQDEGVFVDSAKSRVDYRGGNFSTNYVQFKSELISLDKELRMTTFGLGVQFDGPFLIAEFEKEQANSYGQSRLNFMYQFRSSPKVRCWPFRLRNHMVRKLENLGNDKVITPSIVEHVFRLDGEYILNRVDQRISIRARYTINPLRHRSTGYFIQGTYGRDYLNIRYRLHGFSVMAGLTYTIGKSRPNQIFIKNKLAQAYDFYQNEEYQKPSGQTKSTKQWCDCIKNNF